jgi:hypothetical protein
MLRFPIGDLLDERRCYDWLLQLLHPAGLTCPNGHPLPPTQAPHDRHRAAILDYRCRNCSAVFNLFTTTLWSKSRYPRATIVLILRGIAQGTPTAHLAAEVGIDRGHLLERRHAIQALLERHLSPLTTAAGRGGRGG